MRFFFNGINEQDYGYLVECSLLHCDKLNAGATDNYLVPATGNRIFPFNNGHIRKNEVLLSGSITSCVGNPTILFYLIK